MLPGDFKAKTIPAVDNIKTIKNSAKYFKIFPSEIIFILISEHFLAIQHNLCQHSLFLWWRFLESYSYATLL